MNTAKTLSLIAVCGLATASANAGIRTMTMEIQTDTFSNFRFSVLHSASSNGGQSGSILAEFTGRFQIQLDDKGTASIADDSLTFTSFAGDIAGTSRSVDMRLDASRGASTFTREAGSNTISGALNLEIFDGGSFKGVTFNFAAANHNPLANQFFEGGDPQDANSLFTIGLWGIGDVANGETVLGDSQLGIDLVGRAIPMPTPLAMSGLGLVGVAGIRRRR